MATMNPFDLLGDDDNDDPSYLIAVHQQKIAAKKPSVAAAAPVKAPAKLPSKPLPPTQAVREARSSAAPFRGGGGRGRSSRGRGGPGPNREFGNGNVEGFGGSYGGGGGRQDGEAGKGGNTRGDRGSYGAPYQSYGGGGYRQHNKDGENASDERPMRRQFERKSGTGRGNEFKREGSGRGNWGTAADDVNTEDVVEVVNIEDKVPSPEKQLDKEISPASEANKEISAKEAEEKEEEKEMTLEEYEKVREEKRKALVSMKAEERKVVLDKELKSMKQLSIKKGNDDIFIKLDSDKDLKKQKADRDEKARKSVSINEFLKPAEGEKYYNPGSRGGRGRGGRGSFRGGRGGDSGPTTMRTEAIIKIEDPGQFPTLGGK
ncbi:hypothetical protein ZOSMA_172G00470 [Zostera marina]|uniref:Hyaluronan/mRNA-binding protein domain-containing protein n=1 Tax=Zostera marina TaxID=29655 RepID=A0A0K9PS75_ZOSMR|nr:hypothetical protein ZOSMA_172G00470 [Zostera marina]